MKDGAVFSRIANEERGIAMVTAVLVSMVVLILCTVVVQVSIHNSERSGDDRKRVQAIGAAEAGIDYYFSYLTDTQGQAIKCKVTKSMQGSPGGFTVQAFFYDSANAPISCPLTDTGTLDPSVPPASVMLYSEGKSGAATPVRKMQAFAKLTVSKGGTFDNTGVIFAQNNVSFTSNARLGGSQYSDADVYSNGSFTLAANSTIFGRVFAQGSVTLGSNSEVKREVWAAGSITMNTRSSIGKGLGQGQIAATSSQGSITLSNPSRIYGTARAKTAVTGGTVDGSRSVNAAGWENPPTRTYPTFTYEATEWTTAGYTVVPFSGLTACTDAVNYIRNVWTGGDLVVRISAPGSTCTTTFAVGVTYNVKGNLAIISDGPVTLATNARFVPSPSGSTYNVFVFAGLSGVAPCNITANQNSGFNPGLPTLLYVPATCTVDLLSNSALAQGQVIAGTLNFKHTVAFNYQRVVPPGKGVGGFKQDVQYKREICALAPPCP